MTQTTPTFPAVAGQVPVLIGCPTPAAAAPKAHSTVRVLHVINGEHYSGAERVQDLLAGVLPEQGFEVGFACVKPDRFPNVRISKGPLYETPMHGRLDLRAAWRIKQLAERENFDLLHAHTPRSALCASVASRLSGKPLVYHVHSPTTRDSTHRFRNWLNAANERLAVRHASALICVSGSLGQHMVQAGYSRDVVSVVPNGVPCPSATRSDDLPTAPWTIGTVALFRPRKGLEVLLAAMGVLKRAGVPIRLRAVGPFETAEYQHKIEAQVSSEELADSIDWVAFTDDVPAELARMDALVLPSLFGEGLPMVVLEAMAAGVPVVASRVEGIPEAIDDGVGGLLVPPGDVDHLAAKLRELVSGRHSWSDLQRAGRERHAERFSDVAMAAGVAEVYRRILDG